MGLIPFLQWKHYYPLTDFYTEWAAAFIGICALLFNFRRLDELPLISLVPVSLILVVWLQYFTGMIDYPQQALLISLYLSWAALISMLGHALKRDFGIEKAAAILAWCILAGGFLNAVSALIQHHHFSLPFVTADSAETVYGNLAQQNHFSDYVSLSIASLLYLFARKKIPFFIAIPIGILELYTLALSGSRSSWLYLSAMTMLALFQYRKERALLLGALLLVPAFSLMQYAAHLFDAVATTSADRMLVIAKDSGIRLYLWHEAWLMFLKAPLLGVGFGQFAWHHFCYGPVLGNAAITGLYTNSHDILLNFLAETGLVGSLVLVLGIFFWARRIAMPFDIHAWWIYSLLLVMALHSLDEYPLWYAQFLGVFMLLLGFGESRALKLYMARPIAAFLLVSGSYLMTGLLLDYLHLEALLYPGYHNGKPPLKASALYDSLYRARQETLLLPYVEYPLAEMFPMNSRNLEWKLGMTERVVHFSPTGMVNYQYAALLALDGQEAKAKLQVERSEYSDPDLLEEAFGLYSGLAEKQPEKFAPLEKEVMTKLKEQ